MGLVDKIKNIFTEEVEEEEEEVKVEQIKKEVRSVPIESPTVEKVSPSREEHKRVTEELEEEVVSVPEEKVKTPVFFTDRDFEDLVTPRRGREQVKQPEKIVVEKEPPKKEETPKPYGGNYNSNTIIQKEKQIFKPTPIISPVYGVLDKNYHKEDIIEKTETPIYQSVDGLSVDSIRNKAYGTLEDELEDTMVQTPVVKKEETEDIDLFDELEEKAKTKKDGESTKMMNQEKNIREIEEITMDLTKELDNLLLQKAKDKKTKTIEKKEQEDKQEDLSENDLFNLIDSMYEEGEED